MSLFAFVDPNTFDTLSVLHGDAQLAAFFPNTSNPSLLDPDTLQAANIYPVVVGPPTTAPMADATPCPYTHQVSYFFDHAANAVLQQLQWVLKDAAQIQAERRGRRSVLLSQSDWTSLADAPLVAAQRAAWAEYRQALRDITLQAPYEPTLWPVPPA